MTRVKDRADWDRDDPHDPLWEAECARMDAGAYDDVIGALNEPQGRTTPFCTTCGGEGTIEVDDSPEGWRTWDKSCPSCGGGEAFGAHIPLIDVDDADMAGWYDLNGGHGA